MTGEIQPKLIEPSGRRLDPANPEDSDRALQLRRTSIRVLDVMAELELAGGSITAERNLGSTIASLVESGIPAADYSKAIDMVTQSGLGRRRGRKLSLTEKGESAIADLKSNPELIRERREYIRPDSTSMKILRLIDERAEFIDDEGDRWVQPVGSTAPIARAYAADLDLSESVMTRRLYDMHAVKNYIGVEREHGEVVNIRMDSKGEEKLARVAERQGEPLPKDQPEAIDMVEATVMECTRLAERLGKSEVVGMLEKTANFYVVAGSGPEELTELLLKLKPVLAKLRHEHEYWLGDREIEPFDEHDYGAHFVSSGPAH